jgi:hypothetical protein
MADIPICIGQEASFEVEVCDDNQDDVVRIEWENENGDEAEPSLMGQPLVVSEPYYKAGITNRVYQTVTIPADLFSSGISSTQTTQTICYTGHDGAPTLGEGDGESAPIVMSDFLSTDEARCVKLAIRFPPEWIDPTPGLETDIVTGEGESEPEIITHYHTFACGNAGKAVEFEFKATDRNEEDEVYIFVSEDPGLPNGATVTPNVCPNPIPVGENEISAPSCNTVSRKFSWTPVKTQADMTYEVCMVARDNKNGCQLGGYYSEEHCVHIRVHAPEPQWTHHWQHDWNINAYVGHTTHFDVQLRDFTNIASGWAGEIPNESELVSHYCVKSWVHDGEIPEGAELGECEYGEELETGRDCTICTKTFDWMPVRGQETHDYRACFDGSDEIMCQQSDVDGNKIDWVGHDGNNQMNLPSLHQLNTVCVNIHVHRCIYCIHEDDRTMNWLSHYYGFDSNWLRLWNGNGDQQDDYHVNELHSTPPAYIASIRNPDAPLSKHGITGHCLRLGPVYKVQNADTLVVLASRFHTTVKQILSVNPDISAADEELTPGQDICVMPCTDAHAHDGFLPEERW